MKGFDVWETIPGGGDGMIDFVLVDLHDNLENYFCRGLACRDDSQCTVTRARGILRYSDLTTQI